MNIVPLEVLVAILVGMALFVFILGIQGSRSRRAIKHPTEPPERADTTTAPTVDFLHGPKGMRAVISSLHPFAWDARALLAGIVVLVALALRLWLLIPLAAVSGYFLGELFLPSDIGVMIRSLQDSMVFITQIAQSLGVGNSSLGNVVEAALDALPADSVFRQEREVVYRQLISMQIDTGGSDDTSPSTVLIARLFRNDSLTELRAVDALVFSSLTNTQWRLRDQLSQLSDDLSRRIRSINEAVSTTLEPAIRAQRLVILLSASMSFFTILLFGAGSAIANDFAENCVVSLAIGLALFGQAYFSLRARLRLFSPTLFL